MSNSLILELMNSSETQNVRVLAAALNSSTSFPSFASSSAVAIMNLTNFSIPMPKERCIYPKLRTQGFELFIYYFGLYAVPVVFLIGILGNILNLIVLNSKGMRTKTNCFLSAMAATDLGFFIVMVVFNLPAFEVLSSSETFMRGFMEVKMTLMTFANWFSAASIWIAVAVTVERLVAICRPLHARLFWQIRRIVILLFMIYVFSFVLFIHQWFWMYPTSLLLCGGNGRRIYGLRMLTPAINPTLFDFVLTSQYMAIACTLIIPLIAMMFLNSLLLYFLRRNRREMLSTLVPSEQCTATAGSARSANGSSRKSSKPPSKRSGGYSNITIRQRTCENKVAFMVSVIIVSFILFLSPSALMYIYETLVIGVLKYPRPEWMHSLGLISNHLVTINKAMNFILYCSAGKHFRRKLFYLVCRSRFVTRLMRRRHFCHDSSRKTSHSLTRVDNFLNFSNPAAVEGTTKWAAQYDRSPRAHSPRLMITRTSDEETRLRPLYNRHSLLLTPTPIGSVHFDQDGGGNSTMDHQNGKCTSNGFHGPIGAALEAKELDWLLLEKKEENSSA